MSDQQGHPLEASLRKIITENHRYRDNSNRQMADILNATLSGDEEKFNEALNGIIEGLATGGSEGDDRTLDEDGEAGAAWRSDRAGEPEDGVGAPDPVENG